jgi:hypothetical protein
MEVAEHLPPATASSLVKMLISSAPVVLFSAAVPGQGGSGHLNEQFPDYWKSLFEANGFAMFDLIRPRVWSNPDVEPWYCQNAFIFVSLEKVELVAQFKSIEDKIRNFPLQAIHPVLFHRFVSLEYIHGRELAAELTHRIWRKIGFRS